MIAKPMLKAEDQGILWVMREFFKLPSKPQHSEFTMKVYFKDPKHYGEGNAVCEGCFSSMDNYYFSKIVVDMIAPRKEKLTILEADIIEIK